MQILAISMPFRSLAAIRPEAEMLIGLHRGGDPVTLMTGLDTVYADRYSAAGVRLIEGVPRGRIDPRFMRQVRRLLRETPFDIVYLFNNMAICNTAFAAIGLPPVLVTYRGQTDNIHRFDPGSRLTHLHPRIDAICCVSNAVRDGLRRHVRHPDRVDTIYTGHDLAWYDETPTELETCGIPRGAFTVGCVANDRPRKGVPVLIEALHRLPVELPIHLLLVGQGMDRDQLARHIHAGPAAARIHCLGFRPDAPSLVAACSCSVLPALKREGLPKTVIESMAYGVVPIVTDTGGSAELVTDHECGFVVPPGDSGAIANAILEVWRDPDSAARMGQAARRRLADHFSLRGTIEQTRRWFAELDAANPRRPRSYAPAWPRKQKPAP